jgi:murein DD-endopeptidase MepM/ murein hydrolase activator NlpD
MTPSKLHFSLVSILTGLITAPAAIAIAIPDAPTIEPAPPAASTPVVESAPAVNPVPLQVESAEVFVDKTDYSLGATQPIDPATALSGGGRDNVRVEIESRQGQAAESSGSLSGVPEATQVSLGENFGSLQLSSAGLGWSPSNDAANDQSSVVPSASYLNRKLLRPFSRIGNQNLRLIFPLAIPSPITSLFGWRTHPITGNARMHTGTDIGAPLGTPVVAAMAGRVLLSDFLGGYGMAIALEHSDGTQQTLYGHLSEIFVKPGELIQQGAVIGRVGNTGNSTGPHLHFELRQLTDAGWMAMDAGAQLEGSMSTLVNALKVTQPQQQAFNPNGLNTAFLTVKSMATLTGDEPSTNPQASNTQASTTQPSTAQPLTLRPPSSPIPPFTPTSAPNAIVRPDRLKMIQP